ncbi:MAG TPA: PTS sugar transporter subunit IIC [Soehngenia sp.]|nr:PTS sugar transporter subunit IIC [Soehngenia sp.]
MARKINSEKIVNGVMKFVNLKAIQAIKDGILFILPLTLVGSIFLLLAQLPIPAFNDFMAGIFGEGWINPLLRIYSASFGIMGMVAAIGIAYTYVKNEGHDPLPAGILGLVVFLVTSPNSVTDAASGVVVGNVIDMTWTGGQGMVNAIIVGLAVGYIYSWFLNRDIRIKMPDGVPDGVSNAFSSLIPGAVIMVLAMIVHIGFEYGLNKTFLEWIYDVLQKPLQGLTDSLPAVILISAIGPFLWWFGVHGSSLVSGVMMGILASNSAANQAIIDKGLALTIDNGAKIVTQQFLDNLLILTGSGITIGLVLAMVFRAKSAQYKQLGKIAIVPAIFNINEPITFGTPIVMNPLMFIPFVTVPVITALISYFAIATGLVPPFSGVLVPWTTPPIVSGFLLGGWRTALLQIVILALSVVVYYPFFKKQDEIMYKQELENAKLENSIED